MKKIFPLLLVLGSLAAARAQSVVTLQRTLTWATQPAKVVTPGGKELDYYTFDGASFGDLAPTLPVFGERLALAVRSTLTAEIVGVQYESFSKKPSPDDAQISTELQLTP